MSNTEFARAQFSAADAQGKPVGKPIPVHFNPVSLQYSLTNTMKPDPKNKRKQMIGQSAAKLTMDLQFDTTHSGEDVRHSTAKIARLMVPEHKKDSTAAMVPPTVLFSWGSYRFLGIIETYKETIDFFSMQGVPLRASVNVTLADQDAIFDSSADAAGGTAPPVQVPSQGGQSASSMASQGGNPNAGRQIAADNGLDSMRFPTGPLNVSDSSPLRPPAAFADASASASFGAGIGGGISAGAGLSAGIGGGISGGFGASAGAGFSAGASADFGASAGASFGASAGFSAGANAGFSASAGASAGFSAGSGFSASAVSGSWSAGVSATSGAFAGLTVTTRIASASLDTSLLLPTDDSIAFTADASASFDITGQAQMEVDSGLRADLSANAGVSGFLTFDTD